MKHRTTEILPGESTDSDFVVRKRRPRIWQIPLLFVVTFSIVYFAAHSIENPSGRLVFIATLAIVIGAMSWFTVSFTQRNRDMLLVAEFQNALFASAASLATRFCMIAKRDGSIVYFDPGFQKMFPEFVSKDLRTVDALLEHERIDKHATHTILSTMEKDTNAHTIIPFSTPAGHKFSMMITIDALPRPKGYFLFRGREFVERRKEDLNAGNGSMLYHMANALPFGVYAASPDGDLEFANHTLESWLGYGHGEMTQFGLAVKDLAPEGIDKQNMQVCDYEGETLLRNKSGTPMKFHVTQYAIFSDGAGLLGCNGIITRLEEETLPKKKLTT